VLWPGTFVSEGNLSVLVAELRRALGDTARAPRYLRTVHGYGFAFCAETQQAREAEGAALCRIVVWGLREFRLGDGQAVIGRDPGCEVPIDLATLSRRHARLTVQPGLAVFEDLESKNGSTVNGERVRQPLALAEGDEIRVGSALLSFHWLPHPERSNTVTSPRRPG
jgi:hypothetical protein